MSPGSDLIDTDKKKTSERLVRLIALFIFLQGVYYTISAEFYFFQVHDSVAHILQNFDPAHLFENSNQKLFLLYALLTIFCVINVIDLFIGLRHSRTRALFFQGVGLFAFIFLYFSPIETSSIYLPMAFSITMVILLNFQELRESLEDRKGGSQ